MISNSFQTSNFKFQINRLYRWCIKTQLRRVLSSILIALILLTSIKFWFVKPKVVRADTLLGFNEGYGTTTNDNNGNASGTITNALWKTEDLCKFGKCLYFDGTGDYVSYGDDNDFDFVASTNFTIEGWFRTPDITSGQRTLVAKHNATAGGYKVYMDSNGYLVFGIDDDSTWGPEDTASSSTTAFDDNKWHFFSAVKTGTTSITIYVDGVQYQTDSSISATGTLANSDTFYIGIDGNGSSNAFTGFLDEIKVYTTTARSATEIKSDIAGETPSRGTNASFGPDQSYLSNGLVGYWKMEEAGDATRADSSGNGNTLTESASDTIAQAVGKYGYAGDFEADDTETLSITDASQKGLDLAQTFTFSFWLNLESTDQERGILQKGGCWNNSYCITVDWQRIKIILDDDGNGGNGNTILQADNIFSTTGVWNLYTITYDGQSVRLFKDGKEQITGSFPSTTTTTLYNSGSDFIMGSGTAYFDGIMDEIRVYNRALSPAEVAKLYAWAPGPVGYWKLDQNTGTTAQDSSGNDNAGTLTNTPTWVPGKFGSAVNFAGSNQHITRADDSDFDFGTGASFSYGAWIKHTTASAQEMIIAKYDATAGNGGYKLYMESDGDLTCGIDDDETSFPEDSATSTLATYDDGNWHHIMCVKNGTSSLGLYIDGVLTASDTSISSTGDFANDDPLYIGIAEDGANNDWVGQIDNVQIYNYARSNSQVVEDMNGGHPAPGSPIGSAVAHWKFDEGYGTTAYDGNQSTGGSENLTLSTASWTNSGKFGKAFNGLTNVRASRTTDPDLEFSATEDFTLSLWFKSDSATNPGATEYLLTDGGPSGSAGYAIYANTSGNICFGIDDDTTWDPDVSSCTSADYYDNSWHHALAVRNVTSDTTKIYIDGVEKDSDTDTTTATLDSSPTFYIGDANGTDGSDEFLGDIDEVKVYRSALTLDQIKVEYNHGSGQSMGALSTDSSGNASNSDTDSFCPPGQGTTCTPPVGYWKLDENTGSTQYDVSGNGNNGTFFNSGYTLGKLGSGIKTRINNSRDAVTVSDPASGILDFSNSQSFSYSFWFKMTTTDGGGYIQFFSKGYDGSPSTPGYGVDFISSIEAVECNYIGGTGYDTAQALVPVYDNKWHHVACVIDRAGTDTEYVYIDGVLKGLATMTQASAVNTNSLSIGELGSSDEADNGGIDDVRIYDYARTPAQIAWDYNRGGPVGWFKFDENTGTTANDSSGRGNFGTLSSSSWTTGKFNTAWNGDGAKWVATNDPNDFDFGNNIDFSLSLWAKSDSATNPSANEVLVSKHSAGTNAPGYRIYYNTSGQVVCEIDDDSTSFPEDTASSTTDYYDASWHNIVCKRDITGDDLDLYIDGKFIDDDGNLDATGDMTNGVNLIMGGEDETDDGDEFFGDMDDIRIYRYPLTPQQIKMIVNDGAVKF